MSFVNNQNFIENSIKLSSSYVQAGDEKVFMRTGGKAGTPLLLLHGLAGSNRCWQRNLPDLARNFQVYAPDLSGFGQSRRKNRFDLNQAADEIVSWMQTIGLQRMHLIGHSMGGYIAIDLAARFPHMVDRLVLVSAAVQVATDPSRITHEAARKFNLRWLKSLPLIFPDVWFCKPQSIMSAMQIMLRTNLQERLARITAPTLLLWGDEDPMVPIEQGYALARHVPCQEMVVIESAGHHPMWEQPEAFNQEVIHFLR